MSAHQAVNFYGTSTKLVRPSIKLLRTSYQIFAHQALNFCSPSTKLMRPSIKFLPHSMWNFISRTVYPTYRQRAERKAARIRKSLYRWYIGLGFAVGFGLGFALGFGRGFGIGFGLGVDLRSDSETIGRGCITRMVAWMVARIFLRLQCIPAGIRASTCAFIRATTPASIR